MPFDWFAPVLRLFRLAKPDRLAAGERENRADRCDDATGASIVLWLRSTSLGDRRKRNKTNWKKAEMLIADGRVLCASHYVAYSLKSTAIQSALQACSSCERIYQRSLHACIGFSVLFEAVYLMLELEMDTFTDILTRSSEPKLYGLEVFKVTKYFKTSKEASRSVVSSRKGFNAHAQGDKAELSEAVDFSHFIASVLLGLLDSGLARSSIGVSRLIGQPIKYLSRIASSLNPSSLLQVYQIVLINIRFCKYTSVELFCRFVEVRHGVLFLLN